MSGRWGHSCPHQFKKSKMKPLLLKGKTNTKFVGKGCHDLPAERIADEHGSVITTWKMSWKDRFKALITGRLYLITYTYYNEFQPIRLTVNEDECPSVSRTDKKEAE